MRDTVRRDSRRPFRVGPNGVRRIELAPRAADPSDELPKPFRVSAPPSVWMMAIAYSDRGALDEHARQAISAAAILAGPERAVIAVVLGELTEDLAAFGADAVAVLPSFDVSHFQPEGELAAVLACVETYEPRHIFLPDNPRGESELGRRLAVRLGSSVATRVAELGPDHVSVRWSGGANLASSALPQVILLEPGVTSTNLPFRGLGRRLASAELPAAQSFLESCRYLGLDAAEASAVALEEADFVVSAGHGVANTATLETLAGSLGASVGASRVAVDEGKYPRDRQIGASGKTIQANAYIAVGISGAVQHLQGIKDCRHVIAINADAAAPIAKRADLTVVGDAEEVMQALITRIAQARAQREVPGTK